jgi:hypothetical protein
MNAPSRNELNRSKPQASPQDETGPSVESAPQISWDQNRYHICFETDLNPDAIVSIAEKVLGDADWTVSKTESNNVTTISSKRSASRAAQLRPFDENGKKLLGLWSLKDRYPVGIARGGCILTSFEYALALQVTPILETDEPQNPMDDSQSSAVEGSDGTCLGREKSLVGSRVEIWCQEKLSPYRGAKFPDPEVFYIASELETINPTQQIIEAIETFQAD